jgi:succinate dehydrogenase/fumarate reductase cytochrome b subunit
VRSSAPRALVAALVVLGLVAVVAIAAGGSTSLGSERVRPPGSTLLDTAFSFAFLAVLAGAVLTLYGLMQRKAIREEIASGRYRRTSLLAWIVFVCVFTLVVYLHGWHFRPIQEGTKDVLPQGRPPPQGSPPKAATAYEPHIAWIPVVLVLALLAAAVAAYLVAERRKRAPLTIDALTDEVVAALDEALEDLRREPDPRRAVIAAYVRLERVLAANGLPRRTSETEEEFLARMLRALEISSSAAARLTALFERARFSTHVVDEGMKEDAILALEAVRDELDERRAAEDDALAGATA